MPYQIEIDDNKVAIHPRGMPEVRCHPKASYAVLAWEPGLRLFLGNEQVRGIVAQLDPMCEAEPSCTRPA